MSDSTANPSLLSLRGQLGAHTRWANTEDRSAATAPARRAMEQRFLELADGDPVRAASLRKAHFTRMALRSAVARRRVKEATALAAEIDGGDSLDAAS